MLVLVLVLVLVLERCCLQKRRVNPIRSAFPELHPRPRGWECFEGASPYTVKPELKPWAKIYNRFAANLGKTNRWLRVA